MKVDERMKMSCSARIERNSEFEINGIISATFSLYMRVCACVRERERERKRKKTFYISEILLIIYIYIYIYIYGEIVEMVDLRLHQNLILMKSF